MHAVQSGPSGVLLGADLVVEAGVGRAGVEAAFGDVLAVRLARVLDDLSYVSDLLVLVIALPCKFN